MADPNARDTKLIQYLNEAYGKEKELETALQAHIAMTTRPPYRKRLQEHLKETKNHARQVERRIKQLGGKADAGPAPSAAPDVVSEAMTSVTSLASKAVAAAQGPVHALRGTGEAEKMLRNARTEYQNEFAEIGFYAGIEALAESVGDKETVKLAKSIRREEERMANFLEKQIPQLAKAVAREEIPAAERNGGTSRRRSSSSSRSRSGSSSSSRSSSSRSSGSRSGASKSSGSRSGSSSSRSSASRSKASSSRSSGSRSGASKSSGSRSGSSSARSSGSARSKASSSRASGSRTNASSSRSSGARSGSSRSSGRSRSGSSRSRSGGSSSS